MSNNKIIYLDNAATTKTDPRVVDAMLPYFSKYYGNPSSLYSLGHKSKIALDNARGEIAKILNSDLDEIVFLSGGTESDNLALFGVARANQDKGKHIITTQIEHHAVLHACERLQKEGFEVTYLPVDRYGVVDLEALRNSLRRDTILVSIMYANNEIGTIEPIKEISKIISEFKNKNNLKTPYFHTDACQASGYLNLDVKELGVDLMTLNGSKVYGPKGIGLLYIKKGTKIEPLIYGGGQERGLRSGTENLPAIIGFAEALKIAEKEKADEFIRVKALADKLKDGILNNIPKTFLNGHPENRLPNNVNITILDIEGEALILHLDSYGICVSTGSACTSQSLDPSHVILATGLPYEAAHGSIRFTLGRFNTEEDVDYVLNVLPEIVEKLRKISPTRVDMKKIEKSLKEKENH